MRFTLVYDGRLPGSSNAKTKHEIREKLHPQLKELWSTHPALTEMQYWIGGAVKAGVSDQDRGALLAEIGQHQFSSLVHPYLKLYAELDILLLRPVPPGAVISHAGDIDNQLKTLFDALRRPVSADEVPRSWTPTEDQAPLHCLLDDDKLITKVSVDTDRLLMSDADPKDVQVTIRVSIKGFAPRHGEILA